MLCASFWYALPGFFRPDGHLSTKATLLDEAKTPKNDPPKSLEPQEFVQWVLHPKGPLAKHHTIGDFHLSATYLPPEFMACNKAQGAALSEEDLANAKTELEEMDFFRLRIRVEGAPSPAQYQASSRAVYQQRIAYLAFDYQNDLYLLARDGTRTPCASYVFERTFSMVPYHTMIVGFPRKGPPDTRQLVVNDQLFGLPPLTFEWSPTDFKVIPKVTLL